MLTIPIESAVSREYSCVFLVAQLRFSRILYHLQLHISQIDLSHPGLDRIVRNNSSLIIILPDEVFCSATIMRTCARVLLYLVITTDYYRGVCGNHVPDTHQ